MNLLDKTDINIPGLSFQPLLQQIQGQDIYSNEKCQIKLIYDKSQQKEVIVKVINVKNGQVSHSYLQRIESEIEILQVASHPNIIKFYDYCKDRNNYYLFYEYAAERDVKSFQKKNQRGCYQEVEAFRIFFQLLLAVDYLNRIGIIMYQIQPKNILLTKNFNVKLTGLTHAYNIENSSKMQQTYLQELTHFDYVAPEIENGSQVHEKSDIWCLGVILYELLYGKLPFKKQMNQMNQQSDYKNENKLFIDQGISNEASNLISKMLRKNPRERLFFNEIFAHDWIINHIYSHDLSCLLYKQYQPNYRSLDFLFQKILPASLRDHLLKQNGLNQNAEEFKTLKYIRYQKIATNLIKNQTFYYHPISQEWESQLAYSNSKFNQQATPQGQRTSNYQNKYSDQRDNNHQWQQPQNDYSSQKRNTYQVPEFTYNQNDIIQNQQPRTSTYSPQNFQDQRNSIPQENISNNLNQNEIIDLSQMPRYTPIPLNQSQIQRNNFEPNDSLRFTQPGFYITNQNLTNQFDQHQYSPQSTQYKLQPPKEKQSIFQQTIPIVKSSITYPHSNIQNSQDPNYNQRNTITYPNQKIQTIQDSYNSRNIMASPNQNIQTSQDPNYSIRNTMGSPNQNKQTTQDPNYSVRNTMAYPNSNAQYNQDPNFNTRNSMAYPNQNMQMNQDQNQSTSMFIPRATTYSQNQNSQIYNTMANKF